MPSSLLQGRYVLIKNKFANNPPYDIVAIGVKVEVVFGGTIEFRPHPEG